LQQALDSTLTHLNRLNRSLESVIGIGNEFSNVEALWSQFEGVMGKDNAAEGAKVGESGQDAGAGAEKERESALDTPPVARMGMGGRGR
jgi:DASH complex subunit DAD1